MQCRSPKATLDSCLLSDNVYCDLSVVARSHLCHIVHHSIEWCACMFLSTVVFIQFRNADKRIVNVMEVDYLNEQLATRRNTIQ